jgi:hypothetical protein
MGHMGRSPKTLFYIHPRTCEKKSAMRPICPKSIRLGHLGRKCSIGHAELQKINLLVTSIAI